MTNSRCRGLCRATGQPKRWLHRRGCGRGCERSWAPGCHVGAGGPVGFWGSAGEDSHAARHDDSSAVCAKPRSPRCRVGAGSGDSAQRSVMRVDCTGTLWDDQPLATSQARNWERGGGFRGGGDKSWAGACSQRPKKLSLCVIRGTTVGAGFEDQYPKSYSNPSRNHTLPCRLARKQDR